jgi:glycosyltransferase involved in cell wall biosynthesis
LTSDTTVLPEVAGEAACLVNPLDPAQIGEALARLLAGKDELARLSAGGLVRAARFGWSKTALETFKIYEEIYAEKVGRQKTAWWRRARLGPTAEKVERGPE